MSIKSPLPRPLRLATRRSPLAMAQTLQVQAELARALGLAPDDVNDMLPVIPFTTTGDRNQQSSLADVGGKGLFTKELETALLSGEADIAVHSMKDMPAEPPDGLVLAAVPPRETPYDAFLSLDGTRFEDLPEGARIGTSSSRRAAQVRRIRPDLVIVPFRGNVQTRLRKLADGVADGTFLAEAGLRRLDRADIPRHAMPATLMLPALGQGALYIQTHRDNAAARTACAALNHPADAAATAAERAIVRSLDGSCRTPMAGLAEWRGGSLYIAAEILTPDGTRRVTAADRLAHDVNDASAVAAAAQAGEDLAQRLRDEAGPHLRQMLGT